MKPRHPACGTVLLLLAVGACTEPNPYYGGKQDHGGIPHDSTPWLDAAVDGAKKDLGPPKDAILPPDQAFPAKPTGVDVLIVVDNSGGMDYAQQWLAVDIDTLIDGLEKLPGGASYRIGVTTTDMGVGMFANSGCKAAGDDGKLLVPASCASHGFSASYVEKTKGQRNVVSGVDPAVSCLITGVGTSGCGFEQPLKAMQKALSVANPGFLRPTTALAVIILTNEDDCSAASNALFDWQDTSLGAYKSYRCFQYGVLCAGQKPPCATTVLGQCKPGQNWLHEVKGTYSDWLKKLRPSGWVSALVIAGPVPSTIDVSQQSDGCTLVPSCISGSYQKGDAALRLQQFVGHLGSYGGSTSICANSYRPGLDGLLLRIKSVF